MDKEASEAMDDDTAANDDQENESRYREDDPHHNIRECTRKGDLCACRERAISIRC